ncbi:hypothetical protein NMY22_g11803 [Coprinellus aureogranulatus]|nr:hypothetical protein NMY22_g11803 [Coprinellus aureogranulatus]
MARSKKSRSAKKTTREELREQLTLYLVVYEKFRGNSVELEIEVERRLDGVDDEDAFLWLIAEASMTFAGSCKDCTHL